jgi:hypothetical protein
MKKRRERGPDVFRTLLAAGVHHCMCLNIWKVGYQQEEWGRGQEGKKSIAKRKREEQKRSSPLASPPASAPLEMYFLKNLFTFSFRVRERKRKSEE